jgi:hypothetical protein
MNEIIQSVSNREWAALLWFAVLLVAINVKADIRRSFFGVLRAFCQPMIVGPLFLAAIYAAGEIFLLWRFDWWSIANLKSTVLWLVTFAFVGMFEIVSIKDHEVGLWKIARDIITITVIFLFITELHSFPLVVEIVALPIVTFLVLMNEVAKLKPEHAPVSKFLGTIVGLIGISYFAFSIWTTAAKFAETATWANALEFLIPIALSVGFLPFLYAWRVWVAYNSTFATISISGLPERLVLYARWLALTRIGGDLELLERWRKAIHAARPDNKAELKHSLTALRALVEREVSPPIVQPSAGWSPYLAMQFMANYGLETGHYSHSFDDEWFASSPMREFGDNAIWKNNIAYYIEGNESAATTLKLKLNVNDPANPQAAEDMFIVHCLNLLERAVSLDAVERMKMQVARLEDFEADIPFGSIRMTRDEWVNRMAGGYSRKFEITRGGALHDDES